MKIVNGIDIIEIRRIEKNIKELGEKFLNRIYTENEIKYCEERKSQKYQSYAGKFAAKEAAYKALSSFIKTEYSWKDFEILNDNMGKPYINLVIKIEEIESLSLTVSHCREYAVANVIAIVNEEKGIK